MAYDAKELELQALEEIGKRKLVFADEVISYLPCGERTYYNLKLQELQSIKDALNKNKVDLKAGLRKKWYDSTSATTQIALYKLIGTEEEADRLNGSRQKLEHSGPDGGPQQHEVKHLADYTDEEVMDLAEQVAAYKKAQNV